MDNEIIVQNSVTSLIDSVDINAITGTMQKINTFQAVIQKNLRKDHDYGIIAGAGTKPTLLKPGGEKICMMFGLNPEYDFLEKTEDYKDNFFAYNIRCTLYRNGNPVSQGVGNCNSKESKYAYINVYELPEGFDESMVFEKKTSKYGKIQYKIPNPKIADLVNTILKMAKKRAFIDAVLQVASLSDVFTQDIEDMREFVQQEQNAGAQNITLDEAKKIVISFGTHKGETLEQVFNSKPDYVEWISKNSKDAVMKKAAEIMLKSGLDKANNNEYADTPFN